MTKQKVFPFFFQQKVNYFASTTTTTTMITTTKQTTRKVYCCFCKEEVPFGGECKKIGIFHLDDAVRPEIPKSGYVMEIHGRGSLQPAPRSSVFSGPPKRPDDDVASNRLSGKMSPHVRIDHYDPKKDTLTFRIDDEAHLEFWCEIDIRREDILSALPLSKRQLSYGTPEKTEKYQRQITAAPIYCEVDADCLYSYTMPCDHCGLAACSFHRKSKDHQSRHCYACLGYVKKDGDYCETTEPYPFVNEEDKVQCNHCDMRLHGSHKNFRGSSSSPSASLQVTPIKMKHAKAKRSFRARLRPRKST